MAGTSRAKRPLDKKATANSKPDKIAAEKSTDIRKEHIDEVRDGASKVAERWSEPVPPMEAMLNYGYVQQDGTNEHFKYRFASERAVSSRIREGMLRAGLSIRSVEVLDVVHGEYSNSRGVPQQYCTCRVRIMLCDRDGELHGPYEGIGAGSDSGDKAPMKAMTGARKYAISTCCLLSWGDDPEADASTDRHADVEPPPPALSADAIEALAIAKEAALDGMPALVKLWKDSISKQVKSELSGHERWEDLKEIAEKVSAKLAAQTEEDSRGREPGEESGSTETDGGIQYGEGGNTVESITDDGEVEAHSGEETEDD